MIKQFAEEHGLDLQVTESIVTGTLTELYEMYDRDNDRMVRDIQESPEVLDVAVKSYIEKMQRMTTTALTREKDFARYVYQLLVNGG